MKKKTIAVGDKVILKLNLQEMEIVKIEKTCCGRKETMRVSFVNYPPDGFIDRKITFTFKNGDWAYGYEIKIIT